MGLEGWEKEGIMHRYERNDAASVFISTRVRAAVVWLDLRGGLELERCREQAGTEKFRLTTVYVRT